MITGVLESSDNQVYDELAQASGGQVLSVPKSQLIQATDIIFDSSSSTMVKNQILFVTILSLTY